MAQLAAWRAPHDLRLAHRASRPSDAEAWEWGKWLPHQRVDPDVRRGRLPARALAARARGAARARAAAARSSSCAGSPRPTSRGARRSPLVAPELVVILDGYSPDHPGQRAAGVPRAARRGARELQGGAGPARRRARARALAHRRPAHGARARPGRVGAVGPGRAVDPGGVPRPGRPRHAARRSPARSTPLRLAEGRRRRARAGRRACGSSSLLGAPSVGRARRWARGAPRARRALRAPIGRTAEGEVLELDLKQAAEGGMGPHGVLVGATGSGKSELLRSLVAGLAATPRARAARVRARRLQGRRRVRRPRAAPARRRPDHQPAARPVARRPHARRADRRAGAPPDDAARGRQPRRHRRLPGAARRAIRRCRRCPTCW